jgi:sugar transferase EpsL
MIPAYRHLYTRRGKRLLDLFVLIVLMPALLLLMAIVGLLVGMFLGRPVFFKHVRPGLNGQPFTLVKYRTMTDAKDEKGSLLPDEQRTTRFGLFLRSTSLDELPEILNVLRGEMSLVGPRPLIMRYLPRYSPTQMRRHLVLPGITGWAQVNGRNKIPWETRLALDVWYVDNLSFPLDVRILLLTIWKILRRADISEEGQFSSSEFLGDEKE